MKLLFLLSVIITVLFIQCNQQKMNDSSEKKFIQETITEPNSTTTVEIKNFRLITNNSEDNRKDAAEILQIKRNWPIAMQTKDSALLNKILSKDFSFSTDNHIYNRADYIADRITPSSWKITNVKYENLALQFFGENALLTYRNVVENRDTSGAIEIENITWADMYVKENGKWKINAAHVIDYQLNKMDTLKN